MRSMSKDTFNISKKMVIPNDTSYLSKVRKFIKEVVALSPMEATEHMRVVLAVDEALSNVIEHAYKCSSPDNTIELKFVGTDKYLSAVITDQGNSFNPSSIPDVNMEDHVRNRRKGGLGIFMIRQIMDEIEYKFKDGEYNVLRLVKYYEERN